MASENDGQVADAASKKQQQQQQVARNNPANVAPGINLADACRIEYKASLECLDRNNYERDKCTEVFMNYKDCKKKWNAGRAEARRASYQNQQPETVSDQQDKV